jgi:hypothetical protein
MPRFGTPGEPASMAVIPGQQRAGGKHARGRRARGKHAWRKHVWWKHVGGMNGER